MDSNSQAPVLLITFNRPDTTNKVFEQIKRAKVKKLYIANDAPREGNKNDEIARQEIEKLSKEVDWDCELHTLFQDKNLGCGWGPVTAISWAFENEDKLIILEDDCVPSQPFFDFANYCLNKYKDETRVSLISGRSHHAGHSVFKDTDYIFTHYGHTWGWATWKRVWSNFDMELKDVPIFLKAGGALNVLSSVREGDFYNNMILKKYNDKSLHTHVWDFQFGFSIIKNNGLCIVPAKILIENIVHIGTHSNKINKSHTLKSSNEFMINKEPKLLMTNVRYEKFHFDSHIRRIWGRAPIYKRFLIRLLKQLG
jgi:hypothetical protein